MLRNPSLPSFTLEETGNARLIATDDLEAKKMDDDVSTRTL